MPAASAAVRVEPEGRLRSGSVADDKWYGLHVVPSHAGTVRLPVSTYRRRQSVAAGLVFGLVLAVTAALGTLGGGPLPVSERPGGPSAGQNAAGPVYVVQPGDTFWSIARRLEPSGDPRSLVDRLVAAHGGTTLHVGERIPIPAR
ncbi:MAG: LysM peptidoglycan-binding domain-containing protein [Acidimicrobiales bacterium]